MGTKTFEQRDNTDNKSKETAGGGAWNRKQTNQKPCCSFYIYMLEGVLSAAAC